MENATASPPVSLKKSSFQRKLRRIWNTRTLFFMCVPAILFFLLFSYAPLPGAYVAFTDFNYIGGIFGSDFIGFKNFEFLFHDGTLWLLLRNTVLYNLAFILVGNILQMTVAILLNEIMSRKFRRMTQSILFMPYFISTVLVGLFVFSLINSDNGFIPKLIKDMGGTMTQGIYQTPAVWPFLILIVYLWQSTGYGSVIYFAAIMGIDSSIMEVARVDGANGFQRIRYIIIPNLRQTFVLLLLFSLGGIVRGNFGLFYNLVGINANLYPLTDIIETYVYRSIMGRNFNFSYGSAVGLFQSVIGLFIVLFSNWLVKRIEPDYALF